MAPVQRQPDPGERVLALERRQVNDQEARPCGLLEVLGGELAHDGVAPGDVGGQGEQAPRRERDLIREPFGVQRGVYAGQEL